jgi:hypothetical protein
MSVASSIKYECEFCHKDFKGLKNNYTRHMQSGICKRRLGIKDDVSVMTDDNTYNNSLTEEVRQLKHIVLEQNKTLLEQNKTILEQSKTINELSILVREVLVRQQCIQSPVVIQTQPVQSIIPSNSIASTHINEPTAPRKQRVSKKQEVSTTSLDNIINIGSDKMKTLIKRTNPYAINSSKGYIICNIETINRYPANTLALYKMCIERLLKIIDREQLPFKIVNKSKGVFMIIKDNEWIETNKIGVLDNILMPIINEITSFLMSCVSNVNKFKFDDKDDRDELVKLYYEHTPLDIARQKVSGLLQSYTTIDGIMNHLLTLVIPPDETDDAIALEDLQGKLLDFFVNPKNHYAVNSPYDIKQQERLSKPEIIVRPIKQPEPIKPIEPIEDIEYNEEHEGYIEPEEYSEAEEEEEQYSEAESEYDTDADEVSSRKSVKSTNKPIKISKVNIDIDDDDIEEIEYIKPTRKVVKLCDSESESESEDDNE